MLLEHHGEHLTSPPPARQNVEHFQQEASYSLLWQRLLQEFIAASNRHPVQYLSSLLWEGSALMKYSSNRKDSSPVSIDLSMTSVDVYLRSIWL